MKLLRHGPKGHEKPAMLDAQGQVRDLSGVIADLRADMLTPHGLARLRALDPASLPVVASPGRMAPPWSRHGQVHLHRPELRRPRG
jgi:2,4-diketo-3-deoxy-L-fuconate hydrolase